MILQNIETSIGKKFLVILIGLVLGCIALESFANGWILTQTMDAARTRTHNGGDGMLVLPNGKVLITGGANTASTCLNTASLYDPTSRTWTATGSLAQGRSFHTVTLLPNGLVLVVGGNCGGASAELYDYTTGSWQTTGSMSVGRTEHTATLLPNGKVLVAGGGTTTAEVFDPATGTWTTTGSMITARGRPTSVLLTNGKVLCLGGISSEATKLASAELYNSATGTWVSTGSMYSERDYPSPAILLPNGKVLIEGGRVNPGLSQTNGAELYDSDTGIWSLTGSMNAVRDIHSATLLLDGKVLVIGGGGPLTSAELYDSDTGTWSTIESLNVARGLHAATLLPDGQVLVAGGESWCCGNNALDSAETYSVPCVSVSAMLKVGAEDTVMTFSTADFTSHFSDTDGGTLVKIQITNLPSNGTLKLSEITITVDQEISVGDLDSLTFTPEPNWNGNTSFSWKGSNGTTYSTNAANVDITVTAVNDSPVVSAIPKSGTEDVAVTFTATDFTSHFSDPDGDSLVKIKVTSLPSHGILKLAENAVTVNQEIVVESLDGLTFEPESNWYGNTSFNWHGSDGELYSATVATVNMTIASVSDAPIVSVFSKSGTEDTVITFALTDFTSHFSDADGDSLIKIQITSLPSYGTLKLSETAITVNQEIVVESLDDLTFEPELNWNGNTSFNWRGSDSDSYSSNEASVNVTISAVDDAPIVSTLSKSGTENTAVVFTATDFVSHFDDPEGDSLIKIQIMSLPSHGTLKLSGNTVVVNQEIVVGDLDNLTFEPELGWVGDADFIWQGSSSIAYSTNTADVNMTIEALRITLVRATSLGTVELPAWPGYHYALIIYEYTPATPSGTISVWCNGVQMLSDLVYQKWDLVQCNSGESFKAVGNHIDKCSILTIADSGNSAESSCLPMVWDHRE
jgi:hypothetical protein